MILEQYFDDLIFHPVSNCYVEDVLPIWKECYRVLKKGGILLSGLDNGINYIFDDEETTVAHKLPFNPLKDKKQYEESIKNDWGIQFSHTIEEQIGGQLQAGFILTDIYQDTNGAGRLHEFNVPTFYATKSIKKYQKHMLAIGTLNKPYIQAFHLEKLPVYKMIQIRLVNLFQKS